MKSNFVNIGANSVVIWSQFNFNNFNSQTRKSFKILSGFLLYFHDLLV